MSLSVIIPVTNISLRKDTLTRMLRDAYLNKFEIILVLDNVPSREESLLLKDLKIDQLQIVRGKFGAPGLSRNAGIPLCTKTWVMFWDSDDHPYASKINEVVTLMEDKNVNTIMGNFEFVKPSRNLETLKISDGLVQFAMNPGIWRFIIKKDLVQHVKFPSQRMGEDLVFLARILSQHPKIAFSSTTIYGYVSDGEDSLTKGLRNQEIEDSLRIVMKDIPLIKKNAKAQDLSIKMINLLLFRALISAFRHSSKLTSKIRFLASIFNPILIKGIGIKVFFAVAKNLLWKTRF